MHVCLVSQEYPPETAHGGIGTQTWNKAHTLTRLGQVVEVLSCAGKKQQNLLRTETESGVVVHRLCPAGQDPRQPAAMYDASAYMLGYSWHILCALQGLIQNQPYDLINFPEYGAEGFAFQVNRTVYNWVPVIVQLHGPLAMFAERIGWPARDSTFCRTATFLEGESIRLADGLMASSANIADFTSEFYGVSRDSIDVVHCGIDCEMFRPLQASEPRCTHPTILFVGNITASKGVTTVFEAVMRLRSRYPDLRLLLLGKGEETWSKLEERARADGAADDIRWLGFIQERQQIAEIYRQVDIVASPADHEVGVANIYVEAMASGCPVVASTTGGAPEAVIDGVSGLLVPPRDVEALAAAFDCLLGDRELRLRMGAAGRRRTEEYFACDKYVQRVLAAYQKAIALSQEKLARLRAENA